MTTNTGERLDWNNLLAGFLGSIVGGGSSFGAIWIQARIGRRNQRDQEHEIVQNYLLALRAEIETLWKRYEETAGQLIVALPLNQPLIGFWPVGHDYFSVYQGNSFLLGRVKDDELRLLIVKTYTIARGIIDSFRLNNEMNQKLENLIVLAAQTANPAFTQQAAAQRNAIAHYAGQLKSRHYELRDHVERLLKSIGRSV